MATHQTLEELKAENAAAEAQEPVIDPQSIPAESAPEATETETLDNDDQDAEPGQEASSETGLEAWQQSDDEAPQDDGIAVNLSTHESMKRRLKGKVEKRDSEIERLHKEVEALKQGRTNTEAPKNAPVPSSTPKPKRDDFYSSDDPDGAYVDALTDWKLNQALATQRAESARNEQQQTAQKNLETLTTEVNRHYERAAKLTQDSGIDADTYQQADTLVRRAIDTARPGQGDMITDQLINHIGEGSEKVLYYLGRNPGSLQQIQSDLMVDPSGIKVATRLGELKAKLTTPVKRKSAAPQPVSRVDGDESSAGLNPKRMRKEYLEAHNKGDNQKAYNVRQQARKAGLDVNGW